MFIFPVLAVLLGGCSPTHSQPVFKPRLVGSCEGCEAVLEFGRRPLAAADTLAGFGAGSQAMVLRGTVYQKDGKTPAAGVVVYAYHTDESGVYPTRGDESGWGRRHGFLRGWVKTDGNGRYAFYTSKPGQYPRRQEPPHVHMVVMEPDGRYYWIEDCLFEGDPGVAEAGSKASPRGGFSGVLTLKREGSLLVGERNIILGRNIDGHE